MVGLEIQDKKPFSMLTVGATKDSSADFTFIIDIQEGEKDQSQVKLKLKANLSMLVEMMARNPLQQFVNVMVDKLSEVDFPTNK